MIFFDKKPKGEKREIILSEITPQKAQEVDRLIRN